MTTDYGLPKLAARLHRLPMRTALEHFTTDTRLPRDTAVNATVTTTAVALAFLRTNIFGDGDLSEPHRGRRVE